MRNWKRKRTKKIITKFGHLEKILGPKNFRTQKKTKCWKPEIFQLSETVPHAPADVDFLFYFFQFFFLTYKHFDQLWLEDFGSKCTFSIFFSKNKMKILKNTNKNLNLHIFITSSFLHQIQWNFSPTRFFSHHKQTPLTLSPQNQAKTKPTFQNWPSFKSFKPFNSNFTFSTPIWAKFEI